MQFEHHHIHDHVGWGLVDASAEEVPERCSGARAHDSTTGGAGIRKWSLPTQSGRERYVLSCRCCTHVTTIHHLILFDTYPHQAWSSVSLQPWYSTATTRTSICMYVLQSPISPTIVGKIEVGRFIAQCTSSYHKRSVKVNVCILYFLHLRLVLSNRTGLETWLTLWRGSRTPLSIKDKPLGNPSDCLWAFTQTQYARSVLSSGRYWR
jgi:hypothetical protein